MLFNMEIDIETNEAFTQSSIASLPDPRQRRNQQHSAIYIITIAICAILGGANDKVSVAMFGEARNLFLEIILNLSDETPSHDTFGRFFRFLSSSAFERNFAKWTSVIAKLTKGRVIPIDRRVLWNPTTRDTGRGAFDVVSADISES
jgi:hypothetical protein